ncbi:hypothetical protein LEP1GSC070_2733 [Leptospira santarosai str. AIM]|nr:hypothetical protein LEP1GSC070_2733 [Leptospira santarosai str. AIM]
MWQTLIFCAGRLGIRKFKTIFQVCAQCSENVYSINNLEYS